MPFVLKWEATFSITFHQICSSKIQNQTNPNSRTRKHGEVTTGQTLMGNSYFLCKFPM